MRIMKVLFLVLVVILLSSSVVAKEPKEKVSHKDRENKRVEKIGEYYTEGGKGATIILTSFLTGGFTKESLSEAFDHFQKAKAAKEEAESLESKETLFSSERGLYGFYDYLDAYDDYSGINVYSSLFFEEDWLAKRREMAADYFCEKTLLLGGKECWKSKMCESYYYQHDPPAGRDILVAQPTVAGYMPAVSIQGEKSLPMSYKEGSKTKTGYVYKITYSISNPNREVLTYRIKMVGDAKTFESPPMAVSGSNPPESYQRMDRLGNDPLIAESENDYHTVCLTFTPRIRTIHAKRVSEICSPIIQYEGAATRPYAAAPEEEAAAGGAGTPGAGGGAAPVADPLSGA